MISEFQIRSMTGNEGRPDAPECRLIRDVLDSIHRLDPSFDTNVSGGIRIRLNQAELLGQTKVTVRPQLTDVGISNPSEGLHRHLSSSVPLIGDTSNEVHVLPVIIDCRWKDVLIRGIPPMGTHA